MRHWTLDTLEQDIYILLAYIHMIFGIRGTMPEIMTRCMMLSCELQDPRVIFIDSGNSFDPYFLQKRLRYSAKRYLENMLISRPFTAHQLVKVIEDLPEIIETNNIRAIVISSLDMLFYDGDVKDEEMVFLFIQMLKMLQKYSDLNITIVFGFYRKMIARSIVMQRLIDNYLEVIWEAQNGKNNNTLELF
jgi:hypothetical protein